MSVKTTAAPRKIKATEGMVRKQMTPGRAVYLLFGYLTLLFIVLVSVGPIVWVIISSFKSNAAILSSPFSMPDTFNFDAYVKVITQFNFGTYAINLVFPRLGEVWRCGYIANRSKKPFSNVFGSMVADRLADTATVLVLLILALFLAFGAIKQYLVNVNAYDSFVGILSSPWLWIGFAVFVGLIV